MRESMKQMKLKSKYSRLINKLSHRDRRLLVIFLILILLLILCIVLLFKTSFSKKSLLPRSQYVFENELIPPSEPLHIDSYLLHRSIPVVWPEDECIKFFTLPEGEVLEQIQLSNDNMVKDILKDAP